MPAGDIQRESSQVTLAKAHLKPAHRGDTVRFIGGVTLLDLENLKVRTAARAIGDHTSSDPGNELTYHIVIVADHDHAIKRYPVHEFYERLFNIGHVAIAIHVL